MTRQHAAIYARESIDRSGRAENVADQRKWGAAYAASKWPGVPLRFYTDNDIGAVGHHRPGYEELRAAIARGEVAHVWAVEQSRFERDEIGWFTIAAELDAAGLTELHTDRDGVIPVRSAVAGIKAVIAAEERRRLIRRVNDRLDELAEQGRPPGVRPFGYRHAVTAEGVPTYQIVGEQADAITFAASSVLAGWSLQMIASTLTERGVRGTHGGKIEGGTVKGWLTSPSLAAHRVHRGRDLGPGSANWPPIIDEPMWAELQARLAGPRRVRKSDGKTYPITAAHHGGGTGRRYLLTSGLARCGVCDSPMTAQVLQAAKGQAMLQCSKRRDPLTGERGTCTGILNDPTEAHVLDQLWEALDSPAFLDGFRDDGHKARREQITTDLAEIETHRRELAVMWGRRQLPTAEWTAAREALEDDEAALTAELDALPAPLVHVDVATVRRTWPLLTLGERRTFLRLFVAAVTIARATPGATGYDPRRVLIDWAR